MERCICDGFPQVEPRDPYHGGRGFHSYGRHNRAIVLKILDGRCGVAGYFLYYSYTCKVKTMSCEKARKNRFTLIPVELRVIVVIIPLLGLGSNQVDKVIVSDHNVEAHYIDEHRDAMSKP